MPSMRPPKAPEKVSIAVTATRWNGSDRCAAVGHLRKSTHTTPFWLTSASIGEKGDAWLADLFFAAEHVRIQLLQQATTLQANDLGDSVVWRVILQAYAPFMLHVILVSYVGLV